jgi:hypothetical protein
MNALTWSALALMAVAGCHSPRSAATLTAASVPSDPQGAKFELQRAAHASPTGVLVIAGTIVRRCPALRDMRANPPKMDDDQAWLAILQNLADCMEKGNLRTERILVTGGEESGPLVRYLLAKMGIDRERVDVAQGEQEDNCSLDDCEYFLVRVDLAAPGVVQTRL